MNRSVTIAPVFKSVMVAASQEIAFETFGMRIGSWWPKDRGIGVSRLKDVRIEPRIGGRVHQICEDDVEITWGTVLVWEPYNRIVFTWQITSSWKPSASVDANMRSEVEVRFFPQGPKTTRVDLKHHHVERMGLDPGNSMRNDGGWGWPELLEKYTQALG